MIRLTALLLVIGVATASPPLGAQERVPVSELDADPAAYAGQEVTIQGEIIGDYGIREDVVWVQVNDDPYVDAPLVETGELAGTNVGIGVRIPREAFDPSWGEPGSSTIRGPVVRVTGIFRYNDPDESGETFVEAARVELVEPARVLEQPPARQWPAITGGVLTLVGLGALGYARFFRRP